MKRKKRWPYLHVGVVRVGIVAHRLVLVHGEVAHALKIRRDRREHRRRAVLGIHKNTKIK